MNNYKIKVNNEAESKEAQELFFELGAKYASAENNHESIQMWSNGTITSHSKHNEVDNNFKELTLPQLRDLVVLHRNDVKDATHACDGMNGAAIKLSGIWYGYNYFVNKWQPWDEIEDDEYKISDLKPIQKSLEQGLISGADALRALADGEEVLWRTKTNAEVKSFRKQTPDLDLVLSGDCNYRFWIKPCTIRIELEIPACGKNYKHGQLIWILNSLEPKEYCSVILDESDELPAYWWETEEEIKQVVAALRGGIKA